MNGVHGMNRVNNEKRTRSAQGIDGFNGSHQYNACKSDLYIAYSIKLKLEAKRSNT
jgi:hypothetical protein